MYTKRENGMQKNRTAIEKGCMREIHDVFKNGTRVKVQDTLSKEAQEEPPRNF